MTTSEMAARIFVNGWNRAIGGVTAQQWDDYPGEQQALAIGLMAEALAAISIATDTEVTP